jgi:hypothetical protein
MALVFCILIPAILEMACVWAVAPLMWRYGVCREVPAGEAAAWEKWVALAVIAWHWPVIPLVVLAGLARPSAVVQFWINVALMSLAPVSHSLLLAWLVGA